MNSSFIKYLLVISFLASYSILKAQNSYQSATIMFYNVENLYDTIQSADIINGHLEPNNPKYQISVSEDSALASGINIHKGEFAFDKLKNKKVIRKQILTHEFYYKGTKLWNSKKYNEKIKNLAHVISETGKKETQSFPAVVGLCEIENETVLKDLSTALKNKNINYKFSHFNSFDSRGVDVALLYDSLRFQLESEKRIPVILRNDKGNRIYTRDILAVGGLLDGESFFFFVNHWPSRSSGLQKSISLRVEAARVLKGAMDSIKNKYPEAKIIAMGDFNDDPTDKSIKLLNTVSKKEKVNKDTYFNPSEVFFKKGIGTLAFNDAFHLFDQQILSPNLILDKKGYHFYKMNIFSPSYLITQEGPYKGYPFRSFSGNNYTRGYSDHFPIYTILVRKINLK